MDNHELMPIISNNDYFADAFLHESIRESGTPYRFTLNGASIGRQDAESDIQSVYNSL